MLLISINKLKDNQRFLENVRWELTPKLFMNPRSSPGDKPADITRGYMLYVDMVNNKPTLVIMQLKRMMSETVGYVSGVPEDLLREAMHCTGTECIAGMYPVTGKLEDWLKKELGVS